MLKHINPTYNIKEIRSHISHLSKRIDIINSKRVELEKVESLSSNLYKKFETLQQQIENYQSNV